jgi:hypothetical protein
MLSLASRLRLVRKRFAAAAGVWVRFFVARFVLAIRDLP